MPVKFEYSERWISATALWLVKNEDNPFFKYVLQRPLCI